MADEDIWEKSKDANFVRGLKENDNHSWNLLKPHLQNLARRLVRHPNKQVKTDFVEGAAREVQHRIKGYDPTLGHLEAWCCVVLRHAWLDLLKADKRSRRLLEVTQGSGGDIETIRQDSLMQTNLDGAIDAQDSFSANVLEEIAGWQPPKDRVLLLCVGGCWRKVPDDDWARWLVECNLIREFSDQRLAACGDYVERQYEMARVFGCLPDTVQLTWCRKKRLLAGLSYFRDRWDTRR